MDLSPVGTPSSLSDPSLRRLPIITQPIQHNKTKHKKVSSLCDVDYIFRNVFKKAKYKGYQREIMNAAVEGLDVLVIAPTGLGKSLCFQVPAVAEIHGLTVVITPLLSLMSDQVSTLLSLGVEASAWCSLTSAEEQKDIVRDLQCGHPKNRLLYVTPERIKTPRFKAILERIYKNKELARFVVDEAHCISTWGTDFRPAYREIGNLRTLCPNTPIMALTASAKQSMVDDMITSLKLDTSNMYKVVHSFNRPNLFYQVRYSSDSSQGKIDEILDFIRTNIKDRMQDNYVPMSLEELLAKSKHYSIPGIIYCRSRETCETVAKALRSYQLPARPFHKGRKQSELDLWQNQWIDSERLCAQKKERVDIIVATVAFGMGIDKSNCRFVLHYDLPSTFEGFYQETGRAGRDGKASKCILFYSREDAERIKFLATSRKVENQEAVLKSCTALIEYCEATEFCRHVLICRYFGEKAEQEFKENYCKRMCDVCKIAARNDKNSSLSKDTLSSADVISTQKEKLHSEATRQQQDDLDQETDKDIDAEPLFRDDELPEEFMEQISSDHLSSEPDFNLPPPLNFSNEEYLNHDINDEKVVSKDNDCMQLDPSNTEQEEEESNQIMVTNNNSNVLHMEEDSSDSDSDDNVEAAGKEVYNIPKDPETVMKEPPLEPFYNYTPQPKRYSKDIKLELRQESMAMIHQKLKTAFFRRSDESRLKIWKTINYKLSVNVRGYPWIKTIVTELECYIFWCSETENGYQNSFKIFISALQKMAYTEDWSSWVPKNDISEGVNIFEDIILVIRRSIKLFQTTQDTN